jgi:hypothetical protein
MPLAATVQAALPPVAGAIRWIRGSCEDLEIKVFSIGIRGGRESASKPAVRRRRRKGKVFQITHQILHKPPKFVFAIQ